MKKILRYSTLIYLLGVISPSTSMAATNAFISLDALALFSKPAHTQSVNLLGTMGNTYVGTQQWQSDGSVMVGLGLNTYQHADIDLNTSLRYLPTFNIPSHGEVWQLKSPRFRNLAYTYDTDSNLFLMDNIVTWTKHRLQPGLIVGLGLASNSTSNYRETPLNKHAAPALDHFTNSTMTQFAYELGAVLDYPFKQFIVECAYRYIDAGHGQLGLSPLQNTLEHLSTGPLQYHTISLGVRIHHAL